MPERAGDFNQAVMELGEVVCIPNGVPLCDRCPLSGECKAFQEKTQMDFPVKPEKKTRRIEKRTVFIIEQDGRFVIQKRPGTGLLAGLWEFPSVAGRISMKEIKQDFGEHAVIRKLKPDVHIFSHVEWHMDCYHISCSVQTEEMKDWELPLKERVFSGEELVMVSLEELQTKYTLPVAFHGFRKQILDLQ